jgi:hypothetical protein
VNLLKKGEANDSLLITLGFTLCNVLRGGANRDELMRHGLLALVLRLLTPATSKDVVVEMTWVLAYISAGEDKYKAQVVSMGGVDLMVQLFEKTFSSNDTQSDALLLVPLLRTIGNLSRCGTIMLFPVFVFLLFKNRFFV